MEEDYDLLKVLSTQTKAERLIQAIRFFRVHSPTGRIVIAVRKANPFYFTEGQWFAILKCGVQYGWNPVGAVPLSRREYLFSPELVDPEGYTLRGFRVLMPDARSLGEALKRALPDLPNTYTEPACDRERSFIEVWAGAGHKAKLQEFIAFARKGGFNLW